MATPPKKPRQIFHTVAKHADITEKILGAFYHVYGVLGSGFLEKVYENALKIELEKRGLKVQQQYGIIVYYDHQVVGEYYADLLVEDRILVEVKAAEKINSAHEAQLLNYLRATDYEVGLVLNFGPTPGVKRFIFDNERKKMI